MCSTVQVTSNFAEFGTCNLSISSGMIKNYIQYVTTIKTPVLITFYNFFVSKRGFHIKTDLNKRAVILVFLYAVFGRI